MNFQMKPGWEKDLESLVAPAVNRIAGDLQAALDSVNDEFAGRPADEIAPVLAERWATATPGGAIDGPELAAAADAVSRGGRLRLEGGSLVADGLDD